MFSCTTRCGPSSEKAAGKPRQHDFPLRVLPRSEAAPSRGHCEQTALWSTRRTREKEKEGRGSEKTFKQAEGRKMNGTPWALVIIAGQEGDMAHKGATSFLSPSSLHLLFSSQLPRRACPQTYFPPTESGVMGQALQKEQHSNLMLDAAGRQSTAGGGSGPGACLSNGLTALGVDSKDPTEGPRWRKILRTTKPLLINTFCLSVYRVFCKQTEFIFSPTARILFAIYSTDAYTVEHVPKKVTLEVK